jgi:serine/threonine-protein kinase
MTSPEALLGQTIAGKYHFERILGSGGMGVVFEATHAWTGRRVAVKVLRRDVAGDVENVQRFLREAKTAAALDHPNVVDVLDMGQEEDGLVYLVLELLQGESLRDLLHREGRVNPGVALHVLGPIMSALAEAHDRGIVHRDLKPENIFICREPREGRFVPKLLDFGIAKLADQRESLSLTKTGAIVGTPQYMSPEQVDGKGKVSPASDVWSMGIVLYQLLAGEEPWSGDSVASVLVAILTAPTPDLRTVAPELPTALGSVVEWTLQRDPERRPRMRALAEALRAAVEEGVDVLHAGGRVSVTTARQGSIPPPAPAPPSGDRAAVPPADPTGDGTHAVARGSGSSWEEPEDVAALPLPGLPWRPLLLGAGGLVVVSLVGGFWWATRPGALGEDGTGPSDGRPGVDGAVIGGPGAPAVSPVAASPARDGSPDAGARLGQDHGEGVQDGPPPPDPASSADPETARPRAGAATPRPRPRRAREPARVGGGRNGSATREGEPGRSPDAPRAEPSRPRPANDAVILPPE